MNGVDGYNILFGCGVSVISFFGAYMFFKGKTETKFDNVNNQISELKSEIEELHEQRKEDVGRLRTEMIDLHNQRKEDLDEIKKDIKDMFKVLTQIQIQIGKSFS